MINIGSESIFFHFRCFDYSFLVEVIERSQESRFIITTGNRQLVVLCQGILIGCQILPIRRSWSQTFIINCCPTGIYQCLICQFLKWTGIQQVIFLIDILNTPVSIKCDRSLTAFTLFGRYDNNTISTTGAVNSSRRSILQNFYRFNIRCRDWIQRA